MGPWKRVTLRAFRWLRSHFSEVFLRAKEKSLDSLMVFKRSTVPPILLLLAVFCFFVKNSKGIIWKFYSVINKKTIKYWPKKMKPLNRSQWRAQPKGRELKLWDLPSNSRVGGKTVSSVDSVSTGTCLFTGLRVVEGLLWISLLTP